MGRSKRGDFQFLVYVIVAILSLVLIITVWARNQTKSDDLQAEALCKDSIAIRMSATVQIADGKLKGAPILCKTIDKKIKGDKHSVQLQIAQKMARCWEMMGEGRYDGNVFENFPLFGTGKNGCFTCYSLIIEDIKDIDEGQAISPQEFEQFLRETPHKQGKELTFLNYFQYGGGNGRVMGFFGQEKDKPAGIIEDHAYAVMFKAKKDKGEFLPEVATYGGATFLVFGIATGGVGFISVGLVTAGTILAIGGGTQLLNQAFTETDLDSIILVDMQTPTIKTFFEEHCEYMADIAGK